MTKELIALLDGKETGRVVRDKSGKLAFTKEIDQAAVERSEQEGMFNQNSKSATRNGPESDDEIHNDAERSGLCAARE